MTRVLFLDVDGVLNNDFTKHGIHMNGGWFLGTEPRLVKLFMDWRHWRHDTRIVLSSTWRTDSLAKAHLNRVGVHWMDQTPELHTTFRGDDIQAWLDKNPGYDRIAILDDMQGMKHLARHLVQTSPKHGLRPKNLQRVDQLLGYV